MTERSFRCALLVVMLAGAPGCESAGPGPRPDVVVIPADIQRVDRLGAYGNPGGHTPVADRLAANR